MPAPERWARARADEDELQVRGDLDDAIEYIRRNPNHPPPFFQDRRKQNARLSAWGNGDAWACRLVLLVEHLAHFSLHAKDLGLDPSDEAPEGLFDPAIIKRWVRAIRKNFRGPCRWALQVGNNGRLHVHLIAALDDGPKHLRRPSSLVKPIESEKHLENCVAYSYKPVPYSAANLARYWRAKRGTKRLPNSRGTLNLQTWVRPPREQS